MFIVVIMVDFCRFYGFTAVFGDFCMILVFLGFGFWYHFWHENGAASCDPGYNIIGVLSPPLVCFRTCGALMRLFVCLFPIFRGLAHQRRFKPRALPDLYQTFCCPSCRPFYRTFCRQACHPWQNPAAAWGW